MTPDIILRLDREGRLLFAGSAGSADKSPTLPLLGEPIAAWAQTPDAAALWRETVRNVIETGKPAELLFPTRVEEQERFYQAYISPERQGNAILSLFVVLRDMTAILRREQEMSRQNAALVQALDTAQKRTLQTVGLEADLSHELRAPLTNIISLLDLLYDSALTSTQMEWVSAARSSSRALLKLINDALELALIESRRVRLEPAPFSLTDLIRDVVVLFARRAQEKNLELIVRIDPMLPAVLSGDAGRIRQVLSNLIDNALKFTNQGYVLIDTAQREEMEQRVLVQVEVEDSGAGVPLTRRERVFERFAQGTSSNETGSGLGLAISRQLALLMQGSLTYVSRPGTGAVFQLSVPLERGDTTTVAPDFRAKLAGQTLLIVDGNYLRQCLLYEIVTGWGMHAEVCGNLGAMQFALSRPRHPFDIVLIDDGLSQGAISDAPFEIKRTPHFVLLASPLRETQIADLLPVPLSAVVSKPTFAQTLGETLVTLGEGENNAASLPNLTPQPPLLRGTSELGEGESQTGDYSPLSSERSEGTSRGAGGEVELPSPPPRVLLVEDDPVSRKISAGVVRRVGCQVTEARDGAEALELARFFDFDLVLLDVRLPDTDAVTLLQEIKQTEQNAVSTRFAFLTAYSLSELPPGLAEAGIDAILVKPLTPEALIGLLGETPSQVASSQETPAIPAKRETLEVLNQELLWERVGKQSGILRSLIELCKAEYPPLVAEMRAALARSERSAFLRAAHQVRGMMMSLYAEAATQAVRQYEQAVKQENQIALTAADAALDEELSRLEIALDRFLAEASE